jgi:hypothetical protein
MLIWICAVLLVICVVLAVVAEKVGKDNFISAITSVLAMATGIGFILCLGRLIWVVFKGGSL